MFIDDGDVIGWGNARWGELGPQAQHVANVSPVGAVPPMPLRLQFPHPPPPAPGQQQTAAAAVGDIPPAPILAAMGQQFTAWLLLNGTVASHGNGEWGQLGVAVPNSNVAPEIAVSKPRLVTRSSRNADPYVRLRAGFAYTAALTGRGDVCLWGNNNHGQCSVGSAVTDANAKLFTPVKISLKATPLIDIACGSFFTVALTANRAVIAWGVLSMLGIGTEAEALTAIPEARRFPAASRTNTTITTTPVRITTLDKRSIIGVAAGQWHAAAVSAAGVLYTWGVGHQGRLGHGSTEQVFQPKAVDALRNVKVVKVACGSFHTAAMVSSGEVYAFGDNAAGQCGASSTHVTTPVQLFANHVFIDAACGREHTVALSAEGDVWTVGSSPGAGLVERRCTTFIPYPIVTRRCAIGISSGVSHSVALTVPRKLAMIVLGDLGSASIADADAKTARLVAVCNPEADPAGTDPTVISSIACGSGFMVFADEWGCVRSVGVGDWGQLGQGALPAASPPSSSPVGSPPSASRDGTAAATAASAATSPPPLPPCVPMPRLLAPNSLPSNVPVVHVAAGFAFAFALVANGEVYAWGNNNHGQCGLGLTGDRTSSSARILAPTIVPALSFTLAAAGAPSSSELTLPPAIKAPVVQIACGSFFAVCLTTDGLVYAWGHPDCCGFAAEDLTDPNAILARATRQHEETITALTAVNGGGNGSFTPANSSDEARSSPLGPNGATAPASDGLGTGSVRAQRVISSAALSIAVGRTRRGHQPHVGAAAGRDSPAARRRPRQRRCHRCRPVARGSAGSSRLDLHVGSRSSRATGAQRQRESLRADADCHAGHQWPCSITVR
jgi:alpha-tubulin suppressor-like RCC1 family protein